MTPWPRFGEGDLGVEFNYALALEYLEADLGEPGREKSGLFKGADLALIEADRQGRAGARGWR